MCDATDTEETPEKEAPDSHTAPPGHSIAGHRVHGWCSKCPGREVWEELHAWRARDNEAQDGPPATDRAPHPSKEAARG